MSCLLDAAFGSPVRPEMLAHGFPGGIACVSGPSSSGKSSLLFSLAYQLAAAGKSVVYVCRLTKVERSVPLLPRALSAMDHVLEQVAMKYVSNLSELDEFLANLHLFTPEAMPDAIIVDDLAALLLAVEPERLRVASLCRTLALLRDSFEWGVRCKSGSAAAAAAAVAESQPEAKKRKLAPMWQDRDESGSAAWFTLAFALDDNSDALHGLPVRRLCDRWKLELFETSPIAQDASSAASGQQQVRLLCPDAVPNKVFALEQSGISLVATEQ